MNTAPALHRKRFVRSSLFATGALACVWTSPVQAERVHIPGDGAIIIARKMIDDRKFKEAEIILEKLAQDGDPELVDLRLVHQLIAKSAYEQNDVDRAIEILEMLVDEQPDDWQTRRELALILVTERRDRRAETHFRRLARQKTAHENTRKQALRYLRVIDERRLVRLSFQASAAPSTNVNSATKAKSITVFGFPAPLSDEAREQSGVGVNWSLQGALTPRLSKKVKGHFAARGQMSDYANADFDQAVTGLEAGFRMSNSTPFRTQTMVAATFDRTFFGGDTFSSSTGLRLSAIQPISKKMAVSASVSAAQTTYDIQTNRDGPVYTAQAQLTFQPARRLRLGVGGSITREDTKSAALANTRVGAFGQVQAILPQRIQLGVTPAIYFRDYDAAQFIDAGVIREDKTLDLLVKTGKLDWAVSGFYPSVSYRYTDNESNLALHDYERHGMDISFSRQF